MGMTMRPLKPLGFLVHRHGVSLRAGATVTVIPGLHHVAGLPALQAQHGFALTQMSIPCEYRCRGL